MDDNEAIEILGSCVSQSSDPSGADEALDYVKDRLGLIETIVVAAERYVDVVPPGRGRDEALRTRLQQAVDSFRRGR